MIVRDGGIGRAQWRGFIQMKRTPISYLSCAVYLAVLEWCIAGVCLVYFYRSLNAGFLSIGEFFRWLWVANGLLVAVFCSWSLSRAGTGNRILALIACLMLAVSSSVFTAGWSSLVQAGDDLRFRWIVSSNRHRYEAIIRELEIKPIKEERWHQSGSIDYVVDPGPPLRVAFPQPGGILDNWVGIVYDPSGMVMRANEFKADRSNWDDPSLAQVKLLFGGILIRCVHIGGHYYRCWFT
jgi:hypothetical protein